LLENELNSQFFNRHLLCQNRTVVITSSVTSHPPNRLSTDIVSKESAPNCWNRSLHW